MRKTILSLCLALWLAPSPRALAAQAGDPAQTAAAQGETGQPELDEAARQHALAVRLFNEKKYDEAVAAARRAAESRERLLGPEHYLTRLSLTNLADIYLAKQDYEESLKTYRRLLSI